MSKIEIGRWSEQLRRMLGQKGQEVIAGELSPEVSPTIQLEGMSPEWDFLKQVRDCRMVGVLGASALNTGVFRIRNPAGSGVIALIKAVGVETRGAAILMTVTSGAQTADLGTAVNMVVPDGRWNATGTTDTALVGSTNNAADAVAPAGDVLYATRGNANEPRVYPHPWVLMPGFASDFGLAEINAAVNVFAVWTERQLPALET